MVVPNIKRNLAYLFAYKFRNAFFFLFIVFLYTGLADAPVYLLCATICLALGIYAHRIRNRIVKG